MNVCGIATQFGDEAIHAADELPVFKQTGLARLVGNRSTLGVRLDGSDRLFGPVITDLPCPLPKMLHDAAPKVSEI